MDIVEKVIDQLLIEAEYQPLLPIDKRAGSQNYRLQKKAELADFRSELQRRVKAAGLPITHISGTVVSRRPATTIDIEAKGHWIYDNVWFTIAPRRGGYWVRTAIEDSRESLKKGFGGGGYSSSVTERHEELLPDMDAIIAFITKWSKAAIKLGKEQLAIEAEHRKAR